MGEIKSVSRFQEPISVAKADLYIAIAKADLGKFLLSSFTHYSRAIKRPLPIKRPVTKAPKLLSV